MVGATRFELATSCTQNKRATRLRHAPTKMKVFNTHSKKKKEENYIENLDLLISTVTGDREYVTRASNVLRRNSS